MSKTLVRILEVGAVIGAQFVPGLGFAVAGVAISSGAVATAAVVATETLLNATLFKPQGQKPASAEMAMKPAVAQDLAQLLLAQISPAISTNNSLDRSTRDDLFEIDRRGRTYS
jgi:hypothetical protein